MNNPILKLSGHTFGIKLCSSYTMQQSSFLNIGRYSQEINFFDFDCGSLHPSA